MTGQGALFDLEPLPEAIREPIRSNYCHACAGDVHYCRCERFGVSAPSFDDLEEER